VTIMLSFPFFYEICCYHNFFNIYFKKYLGIIILGYYITMNPIPKSPKIPTSFICNECDYVTRNKKDFRKHEGTIKHKKSMGPNEPYLKNPIESFVCKCGKKYKHASTLSAHKKKCINPKPLPFAETFAEVNTSSTPENINSLTLMVVELVKSNQDLQKQMIELYKTSNTTHNTHNTNNSHNNNKTFNMQFFLNETCKDAMNIMDFVDSMTLDFADLEDVGKLGYVEGISNIIIRKLNELDVCKRPIHCSDGKREIMFVKDNNVWEKENGNYDRLRKAIKHITKKNGDLMIPWSKENPSCMDIQHKMNDVYLQIMSQCMGGRESFVESENKIMKKIAKAVLIEK
jgi:hypothetical protein